MPMTTATAELINKLEDNGATNNLLFISKLILEGMDIREAANKSQTPLAYRIICD